ncbi:MAG: LysM peptidoglycan-binding domain-containing protein, partial [Lachnospiraceae bacterium]|nr:LysM peptidoglycan-binding domain-containing protein [Lachnospiraceae bacterium]
IITDINVTPISPEVIEKLPGFAIYYVQPGDSLWQIGKKYYVSVDQIKEINNLTDDMINPGDKLLIVK